MSAARERLRATFDEDAPRYDRARPGYPAELFDALAVLAGVGPGCHVLEIGPGTGQATRSLAERGCEIVAVELGPRLAAVAAERLARFPRVEVVVADFERMPLPERAFDVVFASAAFHWLDPESRAARVADALRPDGALAVVSGRHVAGAGDAFFAEAQGCYERFDPETPPGGAALPRPEDVPPAFEDVDASQRFARVERRRFLQDIEYTTESYLDVLQTYSGHRALPPQALASLLGCVREVLERHGGRIVKRYLLELVVARRGG